MQGAVAYLQQKYDPLAMILYGSYADGTMDQNSDLDILVITESACCHDMSVIDGVQLDAFVISRDRLRSIDPADYIQLYDGKVIFRGGYDPSALIAQVRTWVHDQPVKTREQIGSDIRWCEKMLERTRRADPEGFYRWHWVLTESLQIFCDAVGRFYFGPKKSMKWMQSHFPESYEIYRRALSNFDGASLEMWIRHLRRIFEQV